MTALLLFTFLALANPPQFCTGLNSPAVDAGKLTPEHCPVAGKNDGGCIQWYGKAPDIGACETVIVPAPPKAPVGVQVKDHVP